MAKAKAPPWLTQTFVDGIDDREEVYRDGAERWRSTGKPYRGANPWCWLAHFDPMQRPCAGQPGKVIERFHFIPRQRVEAALGALLPPDGCRFALDPSREAWEVPHSATWEFVGRDDLILLAAWDPRNGGLGCELHHRRVDSHADSRSAPAITIPAFNLPEHVDDFIGDYELEAEAEHHFEAYAPLGEGDRAYIWGAPR